MGEALAPMMKVRLARIEPRSVGTLGRDRQVDMRMSGVGVERHHIAELPFEFDARERLDGIMDGCGIGRTAGHRQHHRHRGRSVLPMRVHRLIEHVPVGSNRLQALFLSDEIGRAWWRARVCPYAAFWVVAVTHTKTKLSNN